MRLLPRAFFRHLLPAWLLMLAAVPATAGNDQAIGDLDGDGLLTVLDVTRLVNHFRGTVPLAPKLALLADVNQDGVINSDDVTALVRLIVGAADPQTLPLATIRDTSPYAGEGGVALTREVVVHFTLPLSLQATLSTYNPDDQSTGNLSAQAGGRTLLSRVELSSDRLRATLFFLEPVPANSQVTVTFNGAGVNDLLERPLDAAKDGVGGGAMSFTYDTLPISPVAGTGVIGRVFASELVSGAAINTPLAGVTITVDGAEETLRTTTDAQGNFTLTPAPAGRFFVFIDGRTATNHVPAGAYYAFVGKAWETVAGKANNLAAGTGQIFLPLIPAGTLHPVSATNATPITFTPAVVAANPQLAGVSITIPPNNLYANNGTRGGMVGIAPVSPDRLPEPLPPGLRLPLVITVQTDGATNFDQPVPVVFPNVPDPVTGRKLAPGARSALWSFNHEKGKWEVVGPMTVSSDGNFVTSDLGVGIRKPGWHGTQPSTGNRGGGHGPRAGPGGGGPGFGDGPNDDTKKECDPAAVFQDALTLTIGALLLVNPEVAIGIQVAASLVALGADALAYAQTKPQSADELTAVAAAASDGVGAVTTLGWQDGKLFTTPVKQLAKTAAQSGSSSFSLPFLEAAGPLSGIIGIGLTAYDLGTNLQNCMGPIQSPSVRRAMVAAAVPGGAGGAVASSGPPDGFSLARAQYDIGVIEAFVDQLESALAPTISALDTLMSPQLARKLPAGRLLILVRQNGHLKAYEADGSLYQDAQGVPFDYPFTALVAPGNLSQAVLRTAMADLPKGAQAVNDLVQPGSVRMQQFTTACHDLAVFAGVVGQGEAAGGSGPDVASAAPVLAPSTNRPFYVVVNEVTGTVLTRGRTTASGGFDFILPPNTVASLALYDPVTKCYTKMAYDTGPAGSSNSLQPQLTIPDQSGDRDHDGLSELAEFVIGTDPLKADTNGDGITDEQSVLEGIDPLAGTPLTAGVVAVAQTGQAGQPGNAVDVAAINDLALVADSEAGVSVFNVFNGLNPVKVAQVATPAPAIAISCTGSLAAVATGLSGVAALDLSRPSQPLLTHQIPLKGSALAVATQGPLAFAGCSSGDVYALDLATGATLAHATVPAPVEDVAARGGYLYVLTVGYLYTIPFRGGDFGASVVLPVPGPKGLGGDRLRLFAGATQLYSVFVQGFNVYDLADPGSPSVQEMNTNSQAGWRQLVANGSGLALATVGNTSNPDDPHAVALYNLTASGTKAGLVTTFTMPGNACATSIYNGIGYAACSRAGLAVVRYLPFDTRQLAPTVSLTTNFVAGSAPSGALMHVTAAVGDDVQVRNVEFYLDGVKQQTDGNFPFSYDVVTPIAAPGKTSFTLQARATDTGGNATWSALQTLTLTEDAVSPTVAKFAPVYGAASTNYILILFSEPLNPATAVADNVQIVGAGPDGALGTVDDTAFTDFTVTYRSELNGLAIALNSPLPERTYQVILTRDITDAAGNPLAQSYSHLFYSGPGTYWIGAGGLWSDPANWSTGAVPGAEEDVVIEVPMSSTVIYDAAYSTVKSLRCSGNLSVTNGTFSVTGAVSVKGRLALSNYARFRAASLSVTGALTLDSGALVVPGALAMQGPLTMSGPDVELDFATISARAQDAITLYGMLRGVTLNCDASVNGAISITQGLKLNGTVVGIDRGNKIAVVFTGGDQSISGNGVLKLTSNKLIFSQGDAEAVTIESGITVIMSGGTIGYSSAGFPLINRGTILAGTPGAALSFAALPFINTGTVQITNGNRVDMQSLQNSGTITVDAQSSLTIEGSWHNDGAITSAGALSLGGRTTLAQLQSIHRTGGALKLTGTLDNLPPSAPGGLTSRGVTSAATWLVWTDHASNETGFQVERSADGTSFSAAGSVPPDVVTFQDTGLSPGQTYHYRVRAYNGVGISAWSNVVMVSTPAAGAMGGGLLGTWYVRSDVSGPALQQEIVPDVSGQAAPESAGSATWTGKVIAPLSETYTFQATNLASLTVNGQPLFASTLDGSGSIALLAGQTYDLALTVIYAGTSTLTWSSPSIPQEIIPSRQLLPPDLTQSAGPAYSPGGTQLVLAGSNANFSLDDGGSILGGSVTSTDGTPLQIGLGNLTAVTLHTNATILAHGVLGIRGGLTLDQTTLTLSQGGIYFYGGDQTVGGTGQVDFAGSDASLFAQPAEPGTLTFGPGITIHGGGGTIGSASYPVVNQGTISADLAGKTLSVVGGPLTNSGTLSAIQGATLYTANLRNSSKVSFDSTSTVTLDGEWLNTGTLTFGGTLNLAGIFSQSDLGTFRRTGGTVNLIGTMDDRLAASPGAAVVPSTGATNLWLTWTDLSDNELGFSIERSSDGTHFAVIGTVPSNTTSFFDTGLAPGRAYMYRVSSYNRVGISAASNVVAASTTITGNAVGGLTVEYFSSSDATGTPVGTAVVPGVASQKPPPCNSARWTGKLHAPYTETYQFYTDYYPTSVWLGGMLVLDQSVGGFSLDLTAGQAYDLRVEIHGGNQATLRWSSPSTPLDHIPAPQFQPAVYLNATGPTISSQGGDFVLDAARGDLVLAQTGLIKGGTIATAGGASLIVSGATFDGVTLLNDLTVEGASLNILHGLTLNQTLRLGVTDGGSLNFAGSDQTLSGNGQVIFGGNYGSLYQADSNTLTIGSGITVHGGPGVIGSGNAPVINLGIIDADVNGQTILIQASSFTNSGTLKEENGGTLLYP